MAGACSSARHGSELYHTDPPRVCRVRSSLLATRPQINVLKPIGSLEPFTLRSRFRLHPTSLQSGATWLVPQGASSN